MKLTDRFDKGEYVITSEVGPAKGCLRRSEAEAPPDLVQEALEIRNTSTPSTSPTTRAR